MDIEVQVINFKPWIRLIDLYEELGLNKTVFKRYVNYNLIESESLINGVDFIDTNYKKSKGKKSLAFNYGISTTLAKHFCFNQKTPHSREIIEWIIELEKEHFIFS
jgi:phage anti-repressor protein